ncbi:hypothetical protein [Saccharothrix sp. NRRL B-16314]|uniref:hypothetical protein n=1 Tax=Saccharothrix sp. NRRL B-16314 TaxID=1463825 RepID=UPI000527D69D|nr:hypothetical protein [Saccharothrix sp. NRRL B-16314]
MHISDDSVYNHTYIEVAPACVMSVDLLSDDQVEVFVGERSKVLGVSNGVSLVLGEEALDHLVCTLSQGRDQLKGRADVLGQTRRPNRQGATGRDVDPS